MIFKRLFGDLFMIGSFMLLLSACIQAPELAKTNIYSPLAIQDDSITLSTEGATLPPAIEEIKSYRVTYTSIMRDHSKLVNEYAWQEAENEYGFSSLNILKAIEDESSEEVLGEEYFIDDKVYRGLMEEVGEIDREGVIETANAKPILTFEMGNEDLNDSSALGPLAMFDLFYAYYFPMTIGEIISHSQLLGNEVVNGLFTTHYRTTESEAVVNTSRYSPEDLISSKVQGDFWVAADQQYVIRFVVTIEGLTEDRPPNRYEYIVNDINQVFEMKLRPQAQAQIDVMREALATGKIAHVICEECIFPVLPESVIYTYTHYMSNHRFLNLSFPGHGRTLDEITALYEEKLRELGWTVTDQDGRWYVTDGTHHFTINFTHRLNDDDDWFNIEIH